MHIISVYLDIFEKNNTQMKFAEVISIQTRIVISGAIFCCYKHFFSVLGKTPNSRTGD